MDGGFWITSALSDSLTERRATGEPGVEVAVWGSALQVATSEEWSKVEVVVDLVDAVEVTRFPATAWQFVWDGSLRMAGLLNVLDLELGAATLLEGQIPLLADHDYAVVIHGRSAAFFAELTGRPKHVGHYHCQIALP